MNDKGRRNFIKSGLIATAGLSALSGVASIPGLSPAKNLKVGIIGTGSRGKGLMSLMKLTGKYNITAIADILPFRLKEAAPLALVAKKYSDYKELLADPDVEAVIIATPFSTHDEIAIDALKAGKHVYCEKTMSKGMSEIQQVLDEAKKHPELVFQTGHQYHSSELYQKVRGIINSGYIGEITAIECQWDRNGNWRKEVKDPQNERLINWRMYKEYSGGLAAELMSHQIDFVNWVTGKTPERVVGFGGIDHWDDGRETFDNAHVMMEYPGGLDATFKCTTTNGFEDYKIKILGSKATIILDYTEAYIYTEDLKDKEKGIVDGVSGATKKAWRQGEGAKIKAPGNDPTRDALVQFHDSVLNGKEILSDVNTGAVTAKCVQMINDSLYSGEIKFWKDYPELNLV